METHVRAVAHCFIWFGLLSLIASVSTVVYFGNFHELYLKADSVMFGVVFFWSVLFHLTLSIPTFVLGLGLLRFHDWARFGCVVVGALNILNLPVGTILGPYAIGVLMTPETELLFNDRFRVSRELWRAQENADSHTSVE